MQNTCWKSFQNSFRKKKQKTGFRDSSIMEIKLEDSNGMPFRISFEDGRVHGKTSYWFIHTFPEMTLQMASSAWNRTQAVVQGRQIWPREATSGAHSEYRCKVAGSLLSLFLEGTHLLRRKQWEFLVQSDKVDWSRISALIHSTRCTRDVLGFVI